MIDSAKIKEDLSAVLTDYLNNDKFELNMKTLEKEQNLTADRLEFFRDRFNTQRQRFDDTVKSWN